MIYDRASKSSFQQTPQREPHPRPIRSDTAGMKSARPLLQLQQAMGNRGLLGMLRGGIASAPAPADTGGHSAAEPVVQGKFVTESGGEDKSEEERIEQLLRTFMAWKRDDPDMMALYEPILKDFEANRTSEGPVSLNGWMANHSGSLTAAEQMLDMRSADSLQTGMEIEDDAKDAPQKRKPEESAQQSNKKKRKLETKEITKYSSEVEDSSDDETTELDARQKLAILINLTASNIGILRSSSLETKKDEHRLDEPLHRKIYAADRSLPKPKIADLTSQDYYSIGEQKLRVGEGRGHFIQAGGNAKKRGKTIKEPPAEYDKMIEAMLKMAQDPSAASLYKLATGSELDNKEAFEDRELAAIMLYSLNHNVSKSHSVRSNLTEHLQKFVSIVGISELSRSFEAVGGKGKTSKKNRKRTRRRIRKRRMAPPAAIRRKRSSR